MPETAFTPWARRVAAGAWETGTGSMPRRPSSRRIPANTSSSPRLVGRSTRRPGPSRATSTTWRTTGPGERSGHMDVARPVEAVRRRPTAAGRHREVDLRAVRALTGAPAPMVFLDGAQMGKPLPPPLRGRDAGRAAGTAGHDPDRRRGTRVRDPERSILRHPDDTAQACCSVRIGENVASWWYTGLSGREAATHNADAIMQAWMDSQGHLPDRRLRRGVGRPGGATVQGVVPRPSCRTHLRDRHRSGRRPRPGGG